MHHALAGRTSSHPLLALNMTLSFLITANAIRNRRNPNKTKNSDAF
jgi:hypothetical protein